MKNPSIDSNGITQVRIEAKLRWIAAGTGLVTMSGLAITWLYLPFPVLLILGAAVAGKWPRTGRCLMWVGSAVLTLFLLPTYVVLLPENHLVYTDFIILLIDIGWVGTVILLPLCDVVLFMGAFKARKALAKAAV